MSVRAFALLTDTVLGAVDAPLRAAIAAWAQDWGLPMPAVEIRRAWERTPATDCRLLIEAGDRTAWVGWGSAFAPALQRVMFAPDSTGSPSIGSAAISAEVADAAFEALLAQLASAACGEEFRRDQVGTVPAALWQAGSGAILTELACGRHSLWMLLDYRAVVRGELASLVGAGVPLAPVCYRELLSDHPVQIAVEAGRAEVGLGGVLALAQGDVVRLDTFADRPLVLTAHDGSTLLLGYLGTHEHHLALDIAADTPLSGEHA